MFKISFFGTNTCLKRLRRSSVALLMTLCHTSSADCKQKWCADRGGFRVWSDPCSNLNFGLIW